MKSIALMTSGGDAPGMNACVRAVVRTALHHGLRAPVLRGVVGIRRAYRGLVHGDLFELDARRVGGIVQRGGAILQPERFPEFAEPRYQREALRQLNARGVEGLVVIGGDGSMKGAQALVLVYREGNRITETLRTLISLRVSAGQRPLSGRSVLSMTQ